ncbi:hypothetical protein D3C80_2167190 [compost metagenome]
MKTSKKITFPKLENEFLENILRQLVNQHNIIQLFLVKNTSSLFSHLIIHTEKNSDAQEANVNSSDLNCRLIKNF